MVRSVEGSLARLQTDYIDLLYLHMWDGNTPAEEVLRAMDDLVRAGEVLYVGISDIPAWQVARMQTMADLRGWAPLVALQIPYNLVERTVERDLIPMAETMGLGVVPWSPLAGGVSPASTAAPTSSPGPSVPRPADSPAARTTSSGTGSSPSGAWTSPGSSRTSPPRSAPHPHESRSRGRDSTLPSWPPSWALGPSRSSTTTWVRSRSSSNPSNGHGWRKPARSTWAFPTRPSAASVSWCKRGPMAGSNPRRGLLVGRSARGLRRRRSEGF